jgi:hypothetical protein
VLIAMLTRSICVCNYIVADTGWPPFAMAAEALRLFSYRSCECDFFTSSRTKDTYHPRRRCVKFFHYFLQEGGWIVLCFLASALTVSFLSSMLSQRPVPAPPVEHSCHANPERNAAQNPHEHGVLLVHACKRARVAHAVVVLVRAVDVAVHRVDEVVVGCAPVHIAENHMKMTIARCELRDIGSDRGSTQVTCTQQIRLESKRGGGGAAAYDWILPHSPPDGENR